MEMVYLWTFLFNVRSTLRDQTLHITLTTLANNIVTRGQNHSNGEESQKEDVSIEVYCHIYFLFESLNVCVYVGCFIGWWELVFIGVWMERLGWNLAFEPWKLGSFCAEKHALLLVQLGWCMWTRVFFMLKYKERASLLWLSFWKLSLWHAMHVRSEHNLHGPMM